VGIAGRIRDPTNQNDEADNDLPSIEEILGPLLRKEISAEGRQSSGKPSLDASGSRPGLAPSRLDDGVGDSQSTRGMCDDFSAPQQTVS
jgi:hypothetical protein